MTDQLERVIVDATAPDWAHAMARVLEQIFVRVLKRQRELEERIKALETP